MTSDEILEKRATASQRFLEVQAEQTKAQDTVKACDEELFRLQGEYRVYSAMLGDGEVREQPAARPVDRHEYASEDPALTITATPAKEHDNGKATKKEAISDTTE